ncbi:hypothetical protein DEU56DRAFT_747544 [Suillus clintonianus]|uniref:uncharacterized protein n=1 Tax=Suillus clintonianus TaxID=1904413 RepID=UPI001B86B36E|nr:uncharacterized protein DEU56DRAFT_747544 [Suillus clintonianus]KAG2118606.1 hypothetical protein DEU56DRAFT_747544 [Suillus clintonianus]
MIENVDGEIVLFQDSFVLRQRYAEDEHNITIAVPMFEPPKLLHICCLRPSHQFSRGLETVE